MTNFTLPCFCVSNVQCWWWPAWFHMFLFLTMISGPGSCLAVPHLSLVPLPCTLCDHHQIPGGIVKIHYNRYYWCLFDHLSKTLAIHIYHFANPEYYCYVRTFQWNKQLQISYLHSKFLSLLSIFANNLTKAIMINPSHFSVVPCFVS